jgi:hypothetical protein
MSFRSKKYEMSQKCTFSDRNYEIINLRFLEDGMRLAANFESKNLGFFQFFAEIFIKEMRNGWPDLFYRQKI